MKIGDFEVNRLGFGAMRVLGNEDIWGPPKDPANAKKVLRRAYELGANFFDTAESYGPQTDETVIAEAMHPYPKDLVIGTKCGLVRPKPSRWDEDGRPEKLKSDLEGSLKRLRLDCLHLWQLHAPDPKVPFEDSVGVLAEPTLIVEHVLRAGVEGVDVEASYYFSRGHNTWGWATWARAFRHYDVDMAEWPRVRDERFLQRYGEVDTGYGGRFVDAIEGLRSGSRRGERRDWFYYVNGIEAPVGSADYEPRDGDRVWSSPIKGTAASADLLTDKDRAENVMIVDLMRNDLAIAQLRQRNRRRTAMTERRTG